MRWVGGQKCLFLSLFRVKNVYVDVGRYLVKNGELYIHVVIE